MGAADYFHPGTWNVICQECGEKWKAIHIRKRWDQFWVCPHCFEMRHPQDFIKGIPDQQQTPYSTGNPDYIYSGTEGTQLLAPVSGFSVTVSNGIGTLFIDPAATLTSGTVTMQAAPVQNQFFSLYSTQKITGLTVSPNVGQTISNPPTSLIATEPVNFQFVGTNWNRLTWGG